MNRNTGILVGVLAAAMGLPYALFNDQHGLAKMDWQALFSGAKTLSLSAGSKDGAAPAPDAAFPVGPVSVQEIVYPCDFPEALRFDITPRWVLARWPRVTTVVSELELEGLRVAMISGTRPDDVAGSLTYYFDKRQQLQRITLEGVTGDERRLVAFVAQQFGLQPQPNLNAGLYLKSASGKPQSAMRVSYSPVMRHEATHSRLEVLLEVNRPKSKFGLSPQFLAVLGEDRQIQRW